MMQQYQEIKSQHKDALLLFRLGDFYELFGDDAHTASQVLQITLTKRNKVPMCGVPHHALDQYLPRLVHAGHKVAICEQVEDPKLAKGVVKREVVEIASPGATLSEKLLDSRSNNFLLAVHLEEDTCGLAVADVSTGSLQVSQFPASQLVEQLLRFNPKEILTAESHHEHLKQLTQNRLQAILTKRDDWLFARDYAYEVLIAHFKTHSLKGFGLEDLPAAIAAAGVIPQIGSRSKAPIE
jgi:DNA mismatch repair protein MutS